LEDGYRKNVALRPVPTGRLSEGDLHLLCFDIGLDDDFCVRDDLLAPERGPHHLPYEDFPARHVAQLGIWQASLDRGHVVNTSGGIAQQHLADMLTAVKRIVLRDQKS
jgi:hypothetical protein